MAAKKSAKSAKAEQQVPMAAIAITVCLAAFLIFSVGTVVLPDFYCGMYEKNDSTYFVWLPKNVSDYFAGDNINLHFIMPYGNKLDVYGAVNEREISPIHCGAPYGHDYAVSMTWREALALTGSNQPIRDFVRMWDDGKIIIAPRGIDKLNKLQFARNTLLNYDDEPVPEHVQKQFEKYRGNASS